MRAHFAQTVERSPHESGPNAKSLSGRLNRNRAQSEPMLSLTVDENRRNGDMANHGPALGRDEGHRERACVP